MKSHIKRIASPKTWPTPRKGSKFITRPLPGKHPTGLHLPLTTIMRDILKQAGTAREARLIVRNKQALIDGKQAKDPRAGLGLMDTLALPETKEAYRMLINTRGKLTLTKIPESEATLKICRINNKTTLKEGKTQLALHDGRTLTTDNREYKTGDSLMLSLPGQEVKEHLKLEKGAAVYLIGGKHTGTTGTVEDAGTTKLAVRIGNETVETLRKFAFVIGKEKAALEIKVQPE